VATAWHTLAAERAAELLATDLERGLSVREAERRRRRFGPNTLPGRRRPGLITLAARQFTDFMVLVLCAAAAVSWFLGEDTDAVVIMMIVVINAILGLFQELQAERSLEALQRFTRPLAQVVRQGRVGQVAAADLVPGDVVLLESGTRVPADLRLAATSGLAVDESLLTGESLPVAKDAARGTALGAPLAERRGMAFMGTAAVRGRGRGLVVATGPRTEVGGIAHMLAAGREGPTPLQQRLARLGRVLLVLSLALCGAVALLAVARGLEPYDAFLTAVSLAVAAIPEGLPAAVTICLALGVRRMIRHNAIVRRLPAVEGLGCATAVCVDKTGTLTRNEMVLEALWVPGAEMRRLAAAPLRRAAPETRPLLRIAALCNNAAPAGTTSPGPGARRRRGRAVSGGRGTAPSRLRFVGDPTEVALAEAAFGAGLEPVVLGGIHPRIAEVPFEPERRRMTVVCRDQGGDDWAYTKGAPATIISLCTRILEQGRERPLEGADRAAVLAQAVALAGEGCRVLAMACRRLPPGWSGEDSVGESARDIDALAAGLEGRLTLVGLVGLLDPPRDGVAAAVRRCGQAGIQVIMVTGDHPATAGAIARRLGLLDERGSVITGEEIDRAGEHRLAQLAAESRVFARVSPRQKLRLVRALRSAGHIVAMTGDGVNDAPAIKEADVGIAMGASGTDVSREAAAVVLADDNFCTIVEAVVQGRAIYDNIRKFVCYLLSGNVGEVLLMLLAAAAGLPLPLIPVQILWVNLVTDGLPATALSVDPPAPGVMRRPPRPPGESILARGVGRRILIRGVYIGLACLALFAWRLPEAGLAAARTTAFVALVLAQLVYAFECRSLDGRVGANPYLWGAAGLSAAMLALVIGDARLRPLFGTTWLPPLDWLAAAGAAVLPAAVRSLSEVWWAAGRHIFGFFIPRGRGSGHWRHGRS